MSISRERKPSKIVLIKRLVESIAVHGLHCAVQQGFRKTADTSESGMRKYFKETAIQNMSQNVESEVSTIYDQQHFYFLYMFPEHYIIQNAFGNSLLGSTCKKSKRPSSHSFKDWDLKMTIHLHLVKAPVNSGERTGFQLHFSKNPSPVSFNYIKLQLPFRQGRM